MAFVDQLLHQAVEQLVDLARSSCSGCAPSFPAALVIEQIALFQGALDGVLEIFQGLLASDVELGNLDSYADVVEAALRGLQRKSAAGSCIRVSLRVIPKFIVRCHLENLTRDSDCLG